MESLPSKPVSLAWSSIRWKKDKLVSVLISVWSGVMGFFAGEAVLLQEARHKQKRSTPVARL
jgi:hypothetical protein